jgi:hypothetical protein
MATGPGFLPSATSTARQADIASWARLLDEHPDVIQHAIGHAGADLAAVRHFLFARQLGLDFSATAGEVAATRSALPSS